jgi:hypothetical protein
LPPPRGADGEERKSCHVPVLTSGVDLHGAPGHAAVCDDAAVGHRADLAVQLGLASN